MNLHLTASSNFSHHFMQPSPMAFEDRPVGVHSILPLSRNCVDRALESSSKSDQVDRGVDNGSLDIMNRIWRVLAVLSDWGCQLLMKIMRCFQSLQLYQKELDPIEIKLEVEETGLQKLFHYPIRYRNFRDRILSYRNHFSQDDSLIFNNYSLETYSKLKEYDERIFDQCQNEQERELIASIAVYEAITQLYVRRFLDHHPELNHPYYLPALHAIALGIAIKNSWDDSIDNKSFREFMIPPLEGQRHFEMEIEFLKTIDWNFSTQELATSQTEISPNGDWDSDVGKLEHVLEAELMGVPLNNNIRLSEADLSD